MINSYDVSVLYLKNCMTGSIKLTDDKYDSSFFFPQINANAMTNALSEESRAWVTLGQRLGQLAGSIGGQTTGQIKVTACGRLSCYS